MTEASFICSGGGDDDDDDDEGSEMKLKLKSKVKGSRTKKRKYLSDGDDINSPQGQTRVNNKKFHVKVDF